MILWQQDVVIYGTIYVKAATQEEATALMKKSMGVGIEVATQGNTWLPISDKHFDDPDLPDVSLSPCMTVSHLTDGEPQNTEEE
jgi:hypothetical protein